MDLFTFMMGFCIRQVGANVVPLRRSLRWSFEPTADSQLSHAGHEDQETRLTRLRQ